MLKFLIRINRETGKRGAQKDWTLDASCQIEAQRNWSIDCKPAPWTGQCWLFLQLTGARFVLAQD